MTLPAAAAGSVVLAPTSNDPMSVHRMGYGAMRITGPGIWGHPSDPAGAVAVLRRAAELGVNFIDTADSYGPGTSEELIREALHPYDGILVATKGGLTRQGPHEWFPIGHPKYLKHTLELSLRALGVERIDLWQLHRIDPTVPLEDQAGFAADMVAAGKIRHVGLSEVGIDQLEQFAAIVPVVSVQNLYNVTNRASEALVDHCEATGRVFIPWFPVGAGPLAGGQAPGGSPNETTDDVAVRFTAIAESVGLPPSQVALAWLLARSPAMLPIPGTSSIAHLEENVAAAEVSLPTEAIAALDALTG